MTEIKTILVPGVGWPNAPIVAPEPKTKIQTIVEFLLQFPRSTTRALLTLTGYSQGAINAALRTIKPDLILTESTVEFRPGRKLIEYSIKPDSKFVGR